MPHKVESNLLQQMMHGKHAWPTDLIARDWKVMICRFSCRCQNVFLQFLILLHPITEWIATVIAQALVVNCPEWCTCGARNIAPHCFPMAHSPPLEEHRPVDTPGHQNSFSWISYCSHDQQDMNCKTLQSLQVVLPWEILHSFFQSVHYWPNKCKLKITYPQILLGRLSTFWL
jgi:hypothetical protein